MTRAKRVNTHRFLGPHRRPLPEEGQNDHEEGEWKDLKV